MDRVQTLGQKLTELYHLQAQGARVERVIVDTTRQLKEAVDDRIDAQRAEEARRKEAQLRGH